MGRERVNRYRSGVKNPGQEVLVLNDQAKIVIHLVDWRRGRVLTLSPPPPDSGNK